MSINRSLVDMAAQPYSRDEEAVLAGSILYGSFNNSSHSHDQSYMIPPPVEVMEDPHVTKCCRMSAVRRTFCLVVVFDLLLTFILWLLYAELALRDAFEDEVLNYDFQKSMFDVVWMATGRFFILILSYALFRSRTPWLVAVSTFLTCVYVIVKLVLYNWDFPVTPTTPTPVLAVPTLSSKTPTDVNNTLKYMLIILLVISSLVLAWVEVWLLDFRVLPLEQRARERASLIHHTHSEHTPLLGDRRHPQDYQSDNFYSPYDSRAGSGDEDDESSSYRTASKSRSDSSAQEEKHIKNSREALERAWDLMQQEASWKEESGKQLETGIVTSTQVASLGKVFKLVGVIEMPPKDIFEELVYNFENQLNWNYTVTAAEIVQHLNDCTDIAYNISAEALGGMVTSRDFVSARTWTKRDGMYVLSVTTAEHPSKPVVKDIIRGETKVGGWFFKPVEGDPSRTEFTWLTCLNLKGWMPQSLIDQALSGVMRDFLKAIQERCEQMKTKLDGSGDS